MENPNTFDQTGESAGPVAQGPRQIGLTLSGGGFRATLFHLGVVRFLYETDLLRRVRFISGVSGGAVLAAHLGLNWKRYIRDDASFAAASKEVVHFTQSDVRNRIIRRWLIGWLLIIPRAFFNWSRTELLKREYYHLYGDARVDSWPSVYKGDDPRIILQSASLTTGLPRSFGRSGYMLYDEEAEGRGLDRSDDVEASFKSNPEVALAVAASSAFPPMFPPLRITNGDLRPSVPLPHDDFLTDGGVFDNFGIDRPLRFYKHKQPHKNDQLDAFLISDAEGSFVRQIEGGWRFKFALQRNVRATRLLMKRLTTLTWNHLMALQSHEFVGVTISRKIKSNLPDEIQDAVKMIRTDLDGFSDLEVECIVKHGYAATRAELISKKWVTPNAADSSWCPVNSSTLSIAEQGTRLLKSCKRRWLPLVWASQDPFAWLLLTTLVIILTCLALFSIK